MAGAAAGGGGGAYNQQGGMDMPGGGEGASAGPTMEESTKMVDMIQF
jgi:hypothetical protein